MGFRLGDFAFDRIQLGIAENFNDEILYGLFQLADATIEVTAESEDINDKDGNLIRRRWKSKSGTFTANNAMLNVNILAASSGNPLEISMKDKVLEMPKIELVNAGSTITLTDAIEGTIKVAGAYANGATGDNYELGTLASATEFAYDTTTKKLTPPTVTGEDAPTKFMVIYQTNSDGYKVANTVDKFPETIKLTLKALYVDPCLKGYVRPAYIVLPSFQPSPEASVATATDTQLEYSGDLQVDYCGSEKALYYIYFPDEQTQDVAA
ncbi:MAG: hypothetical protein Q4G33_14580 [bacterium]|nr:hypothetical protein [bacterium]